MSDHIKYAIVRVQHANIKKELSLIVGTIAGWHWSDKTASLHIYTSAGVFPATCSAEEFEKILVDGTREPSYTKLATQTITGQMAKQEEKKQDGI